LCFFVCFSAQALSAVFTSDKLLLIVLINVLHSNIKKVSSLSSCSAEAMQTTGRCSNVKKHNLSKTGGRSWRQKSATMPAKRNCVSCKSRRLSEPLVTSVEQMQISRTFPGAKISPLDRTSSDFRPAGATSKPSSYSRNPVWLSSTAPSRSCVVAATACGPIEPLVVNPVYGSNDCSTLKSLSFEKQDLSHLREYTSALSQILRGSHHGVSDFQFRASFSSADEEKCRTAVTPAPSDCAAADENIDFSFLEDRTAVHCVGVTNGDGYMDASCQGSESSDSEARSICAQFGYRKICVYLQEGTWRHSPHSLHCIRIDNNISLVVLCEVMPSLQYLLLTALIHGFIVVH